MKKKILTRDNIEFLIGLGIIVGLIIAILLGFGLEPAINLSREV